MHWTRSKSFKIRFFRNLLGCILKDFQIIWGVELSDRHQRFFVDFDGARWLSMIHTFQNISLNFSVASDVRSLFQRHSSMVWYVGVFALPGMRGGKFCAFLKEGFLSVRDGCFPHALNDRQWSQMLLNVWKVLSIPTVFLIIFTAFLCCQWLKADFSRKTLKYIEKQLAALYRDWEIVGKYLKPIPNPWAGRYPLRSMIATGRLPD